MHEFLYDLVVLIALLVMPMMEQFYNTADVAQSTEPLAAAGVLQVPDALSPRSCEVSSSMQAFSKAAPRRATWELSSADLPSIVHLMLV